MNYTLAAQKMGLVGEQELAELSDVGKNQT